MPLYAPKAQKQDTPASATSPVIRSGDAPCSSSLQTLVQPKLTVGGPDDVYEREADQTADRVLRMEDPLVRRQPAPPVSFLQRKCAHCEEEENLQRKEAGAEATAGRGVESFVNSLGGGKGEPLSVEARQFYEPRFGRDFSRVRVHTDAAAAASAAAINALAYTTGTDIVFNKGQYAPDTASGKKLLAHELTHVAQQGGNKVVQRLSFDECDGSHQSQVQAAHDHAIRLLHATRRKLWAYDGAQPAAVQAALQRHFHTTSQAVARLVADNLTHLLYMCNHVQYECHANEYYGSTLAWSAWCVPFTDVLVYKLFFDRTDINERANTLIHEWGHKYLCLLDLGYTHEPAYQNSGTTRALSNAEPYGNIAVELGQ